MLGDLHGKSVFDLNAEREAELARRRAESRRRTARTQLLARGPPADRPAASRSSRPGARTGARSSGDGYTVRKLVFATEPGIEVPALLFTPEKVDAGRAAGRRGRVRRGRGDRRRRAGRGPAREGPARAGRRPPRDGRDGPRRRRGPARFGADVKEAFLVAPPRPPPARAAGRRPARGARRAGRRVPRRVRASSAAGPPGRSPCTRRRSSRGSVALDARRRDHVLVRRRPDAGLARPARQRRPRRARVLRPARPGGRARPPAADDPRGGRPGGPAAVAGADRRGLRRRQEGLSRARRARALWSCRPGRPGRRARPWSGPSTWPSARSQTVDARRRQDGDGQAARRGRAPRPDPRGGPRGAGQGRGQRQAGHARRRATTTCRSRSGGVQVDCPITGGYRDEQRRRPLGAGQGRPAPALAGGLALDRAGDASSTRPASAGSPRARRWPTSRSTSTAARSPSVKKIYYHNGLDIGGAEGLVEVVAATDGLVVSAGTDRAGRATRTPPSSPRYDVVYLLDDRGWYYRYSHLQTIDPAIKPGATVQDGPEDRRARQGRRQRRLVAPPLRDHEPAAVGQVGDAGGLRLPLGGRTSASRSPSSSPSPGRTTWPGPASTVVARRLEVVEPVGPDRALRVDLRRRHDRDRARGSSGPTTARGRTARSSRSPTAPGRVDYDFAVVQVLDRANPEPLPPTIHAAYCADLRDQARRPGHVQGADLPDDRRPGDLGLRRRHARRRRPVRRQRRPARQGRLRRHDPPLREAGPLPRPRRADRPPRRHGDRGCTWSSKGAVDARSPGRVRQILEDAPIPLRARMVRLRGLDAPYYYWALNVQFA